MLPTPVDVHLLFPPPWSAFHSVHLSLPLLAGHLKSKGLRAATTDLNILVANRLLRADEVRAAAARLEAQMAAGRAGLSDEEADQKETALAAAPLVADEVAPALALLRDASDRLDAIPGAAQVLRLASMVLLAPDAPASWDVVYGNYRARELAKSYALDEAMRALKRTELDAVERALREECLAAVRARPARLYGFGLACSEQLFPALRCARWIREVDPAAKIVVGGAAVPFLEKTIPLVPSFFDTVDYIVIQDGEEPLVELLRAIDGGTPVDEVPNLMFRDAARKVRKSAKSWSAGFEPPACPDFKDVDVRAYLAPPTLPYLTGRRCYWNRCTFCSITYDKSTPYGPTSIDVIVAHLREMAEQTGVRTFQFTDEVVPAPRVRRLADAITAAGLDVTWDALLRFEKLYSEDTFARAYRAGFRAAYFGLETGSAKVLERMDKGTNLDVTERVLREGSAAGIYMHCFVMCGFPGEEEEDFRMTVDFVRRNSEFIDSIASGHFSADLISPCGEDPEAFGLGERSLPPLSLSHQLPQPDREPMMVERVLRFRGETADLHASYLNMGTLNAGNLLARLGPRGKDGFRDLQLGLARQALEGRRALAQGAYTPVRLARSVKRGAPRDGQIPVLDVATGAFAILPATAVALAERGTQVGAFERALQESGAPAGLSSSLLEQRLLVAEAKVPSTGAPRSKV